MSDSKNKKRRFSGNHQRSWQWGSHAACETLRSGRWPILEIHLTQKARDQHASLLQPFIDRGISLEVVSSSRLSELVQNDEHQGIVLRLASFPYTPWDEFLASLACHASESGSAQSATSAPLVVLCDRIQDTFNFGAILRCCDGAQVLGVIVGSQHQAEVTPQVARASSGAVNHLPIVQSSCLLDAVQQLRQLGYQIVAADVHAQVHAWHAPLRGKNVLVVGSEAHGIQPDLLAASDQRILIPLEGKVSSLNAAVAAGILLYEIRRQQALGAEG